MLLILFYFLTNGKRVFVFFRFVRQFILGIWYIIEHSKRPRCFSYCWYYITQYNLLYVTWRDKNRREMCCVENELSSLILFPYSKSLVLITCRVLPPSLSETFTLLYIPAHCYSGKSVRQCFGRRGSIPDIVIPKTQKWYLMPPCLTLSIIRYYQE